MARHIVAVVVYLGITLVLAWPLAWHVGALVPHDPGDPLLSTWNLWWNAQVLPFTEAWWHGPIYYPARDTLTYSDHRVGIGLIATPLMWLGGSPLAAHNVAFLLSFVLSAATAYALCFALTRNRAAAFLGGLVFGFHPFRAEHLPHLELLSAYWLPVVLLALHRWASTYGSTYATSIQQVDAPPDDAILRAPDSGSTPPVSRPGDGRHVWLAVLAIALVGQALTCGYYFIFSGVLVGLWLVWFTPRRLPLRHYAELGVALAVPLLLIAPVLLRYRQAHQRLGFSRVITEIEGFSADVIGLLTAPELLAIWNTPEAWRKSEGALLPGLWAVLLIVAAVLSRRARPEPQTAAWRWTRRVLLCGAIAAAAIASLPVVTGSVAWELGGLRISVSQPYKPLSIAVLLGMGWLLTSARARQAWRARSPLAFYAMATVAMWIFALGPTGRFLGHRVLYKAPYAWLMLLPGFRDEFRVPARFAMIAALTLGVAAALAFVRLAATRPATLQRVAFGLLAVGITADGWFHPFPVWPAPRPLEIPAGAPPDAVVMELPIGEYPDGVAMYRAIAHGRPILNGMSGYEPAHFAILRGAMREGRVEVLPHMATDADLLIFVPREGPSAPLSQAIQARTAAKRIAITSEHEVLLLPRSPRGLSAPIAAARTLPIASIHSASTMTDADKLHDGGDRTVWVASTQRGDEQFIVDLGHARDVAGITIGPGPHPGSFPRALAVDLSLDLQAWTTAWQGDTAAHSVAAALAEPLFAAFTLELEARPARYVRVRQTAQSRDPWAVSEVRILGPR